MNTTKIIFYFNSNFIRLFNMIFNKMKKVNTDSYKNKFSLLKWIFPSSIIDFNKNILLHNEESIKQRNIEFVYKADTILDFTPDDLQFYKANIEYVRNIINNMTQDELGQVWNYLTNMLDLVKQYEKI